MFQKGVEVLVSTNTST